MTGFYKLALCNTRDLFCIRLLGELCTVNIVELIYIFYICRVRLKGLKPIMIFYLFFLKEVKLSIRLITYYYYGIICIFPLCIKGYC